MSEPTPIRPRVPGATPATPVPPRAPVGETKRPREWRSSRNVEERSVLPPRVVKAMPARDAEPAAGSVPSLFETPGSPPAATVAPAFAPLPSPPDLPASYGVDRLVVLVRDPYWTYAWWELTEGNLADGRSAMGPDAALVLRVYDISTIVWDGTNHHSHFDVAVEDLGGSWYLELAKPGASFLAELGLRALDGRFLALVRSNVVTLPRDTVSDVVDEEWMVVGEEQRVLFELAGGGSLGLGSGDIPRLLEQRLRSEMASGLSSRGASSPAFPPTPRPTP
jgi:hypothetical protein